MTAVRMCDMMNFSYGSKTTNAGRVIKRFVASALALTFVMAIMAQVIFGYCGAYALGTFSEYDGETGYMFGTDFSELTVGDVYTKNSTVKRDGVKNYDIIPKNSQMTVLSDGGNNFLRVSRSSDTTADNDPYIDFYDSRFGVYNGNFVIEAAFRLGDYNLKSSVTLIQVIDRNKGKFQSFVNMGSDGSLYAFDGADTGMDLTKDAWTHIAVAVNRTGTDTDTYTLYINGKVVRSDIKITGITQINQVRISQFSSRATGTGCLDIDNVWCYAADEPQLLSGSGASDKLVLGKLDMSELGATVSGVVTTDDFEIDTKSNVFGVIDDTYRKLFKLDHSKGEPYVDIFAEKASGSVVADIGIILGSDWNGNAALLAPFAESDGYTSREALISVDAQGCLVSYDGTKLAELGSGISRISVAFSADRKLATVFLNGKQLTVLETKYGSGYLKMDGIRALEFNNCSNAGTIYISYAELYRGAFAACVTDGPQLEYYSSFDGGDIAPLELIGNVQKVSLSGGEWRIGFSGSAMNGGRAAYPITDVTEMTVSFDLTLNGARSLDVLYLSKSGEKLWSPLYVDEDGCFAVAHGGGNEQIFKVVDGETYRISCTIADGKFSVNIDGVPFISHLSVPSVAGADEISFLTQYAEADVFSAYIGGLEIYSGSVGAVNSVEMPFKVAVELKNNKANLSWDKVFFADGYKVYRSEDKNSGYTAVSGVLNTLDYTDSNILSGMRYYYKVAAVYKRSGEDIELGLDGEPVEFALTDPELSVIATGIKGGVKLTWNAFSGDGLGYTVYRSDEEDGEYVAVSERIDALEYIDTSALPGLIVYYKVCVTVMRNEEEYVFGLEAEAVSAAAMENDKEPETPDVPEPDTPSDGRPDHVEGGAELPQNKADKLFESDFSGDSDVFSITGESLTVNDGKLLLSGGGVGCFAEWMSVGDECYAKALIFELELTINSLDGSVSLFSLYGKNDKLADTLSVSMTADGAALELNGEQLENIHILKLNRKYRITVWINADGDRASVYVDGKGVAFGKALQGSATDVRSVRVLDAEESGESTLLCVESITVSATDIFSNSYKSAVMSPKVTVSGKENEISWRAVNGVKSYTLWRSYGDGEFTVAAEGLTETVYIDYVTSDCSYKVTYVFDTLGVELEAEPMSGSVSAKKPVTVDIVTRFIDLTDAGTVGVLIVSGVATVILLALFVIKRRLRSK